MSTRVGSKGQVVIEKAIRDHLGIEPGCLAVQRVVGDRVEIRFFPPVHDRSLRGFLEAEAQVKPDDWQGARARAWRRASRSEEAARRG